MTARPLRLAVVIWSPDAGGAETQSALLAHRLRQRGHDARVVFVSRELRFSGGQLTARLDAWGVPWQSLGCKTGLYVLGRQRAFARTVRDAGGDGAVIAQGGFLAGILRLCAYRGRLVYVEHAGVLPQPLPERAFGALGRVCRRLFVHTDVAVSDFVLQRVRERWHARRLARIYNGVDLARFSPRAGPAGVPLVLGFAGRMVYGKGQETLLHAAARLAPAHAFRLRLAGSGADQAAFEKLAQDLGLGDRVEFCGYQSDVPAFWGTCDVAVVPTSTMIESFGLTAVEAMACALPVVASRSGGLAEIVEDGRTGRLFTPGDDAALAAALAGYLAAPDLARAHGVAGRRRCEEVFGIDRCAAAFEALFTS